MTRALCITFAVIASASNAADAPSFAAAAASSAEKFKTDHGEHYGIAFMKSAGKGLVPAAQACRDSAVSLGSYHDIVFIVSASGRIERTIHGERSEYGDCVTSHLHMPNSVAKPPSDSWPIQVRFFHGSLHGDEHATFMVVADDAGSGTGRDGSSRERAITNNQPVAKHMTWEYHYLDEHFPGRKPVDHRIDADASTQRVWSVFVFDWHGEKKTFWFDITGPFNEFRKTQHQ
jgi:hypothetical protein